MQKYSIRFFKILQDSIYFTFANSNSIFFMLYRPIWFFCVLIYRIFFRHFYVNYQKFNLKKPTILVSNHNNAFIDPIIFPALIFERLYFIVRGDIFNTKIKHWLLWNLGQIPMFRIRDGVDNLKLNESSFDLCYDLLAKNKNILIFPEGDCVQEKRLRGLKRGTARMAFGAVEKHGWDIDLQLLPTMNNYTYPREFRTEVMTNVGEGIPLKDYRELYEQNENKALSKLSNDLEVAMKALYVHIDNKEDDTLFEQLASMKRNENQVSAIPWRKNTGQRFEMEKGLAEKINALNISNASEKTELILKTSAYFKKLRDLNISDNVVTKNSPNIFLGWIVAVLGFPIYTAGILLNIFQFQLAKHIADKKIKQKIFQNSIRFGVLLFSNMMVGLLIVIIASSIHWLLAVISPLLLMLLAFYTINYHEFVQSWLEKMQFNGINKSDREVCKTMRMEILKSI